MEGESTDNGEVQNNAAGINETVEDIVNVLNMYPEMLGELESVEGIKICQATVIANAPCAPAVLDNEEAKYFCEWMMANNNHEKGKMMINQPIKRLALPWRDEENKVDCGVFAMRHMETYMGQRVCDWKIGLSGLAAKAIQNLRIKFSLRHS